MEAVRTDAIALTMIRKFLIAFLVPLAPLAVAGASEISITGLEPTVLYPSKTPSKQVGWLSLVNSGTGTVSCEAVVKLDGKAQGAPLKLEVPPGNSVQDVLIAEIDRPADLVVEIKADNGRLLAEHKQRWEPQRKWIIYIVKSSHEDLGYESHIYKKQQAIANFIDMAKAMTGPRENAPDAPGKPSQRGFHFTLETMLFQRNYIDERSEAEWRSLVEEQIKPGKMELGGAPSGIHSQWMDYEELARMTYPGRREAKDRFGLDLKTFVLVDNPSVSWSAGQAVADAGFRYILRLGQPWRTGGNNNYRTTKVPAIFWWQGPNGKSRVLFAWRSHYGEGFWYGEPDGGGADLSHFAKRHINAEMKKVESGELLGPYPYDAMIVPSYEDHETPKWDNRALRRWQNLYRYPEIRIAGITDFFEYVERKYGDALPVLSGEMNNFSGDYATIDPNAQGWKRRASRLLPLAEGAASLANVVDPSFNPPASEIERTYTRLFDFTEHSWPTSPPPLKHQLFNAQWVKHLEGQRALEAAERLADSSLSALFKQIPTGATGAVAVFNPLLHPRTGLVEIEGNFPALIDKKTGESVATQKTGANKVIFVARDLPAYGYKVYVPQNIPAAPAEDSVSTTPDTLSNEFYTLRFDRKTGAIISVYDKELKRELVDSAAKHQFNQMIWVETKTRDSKEMSQTPLKAKARLNPSSGAVKGEMTVEIEDPLTGATITQKAILFSGLKRIDIVNDLRHLKAFHGDRRDRYRKNLYYAFPVAVAGFTPRVEYPGGVVRPYDDQLRWGSHDYLNANWWVDVSNADYGVTMAPWNATTVNFGEIRYNQFSIDYKPQKSYLYSYAWSNRMSGLIELGPDEWNTTLGYSFTSHAGDWDQGAVTQFGWSIASPAEGRLLPAGQKGNLPETAKSFLSADAPNVQLATLKPSSQPGRGWVARLVETEGKKGEVTVDLSTFSAEAAFLCDLVENDRQALPVANGKVKVPVEPFSFMTIRFAGPAKALSGVELLQARPVSDSVIELNWKEVPGAAAYLVYRSEDPDAPPTVYSLVNRTIKAEFVDKDLKIDTKYYYYVAPLSAFNQQGPVSERKEIRTDRKNTTPPRPVEELGVVRYSSTELKPYWLKSQDPDIARYEVYRSLHPGVKASRENFVATVEPTKFFLQSYDDSGLKPGTTYYYRVLAEDWAGNRQSVSPEASATTPAAGNEVSVKAGDDLNPL